MNARPSVLTSIGALLAAATLAGGCGPFLDVVKVDETTAAQLRTEMPTYTEEALKNLTHKVVQPLEATSCKLMLWDPPATEQDALDQLRFKARQAGANGLLNVSCGPKQGTSLRKNCWESITCNAAAIQVSR